MENDLQSLRDALTSGGLTAGLDQLNQRVRHRFTAVYRLDGDTLRNVAIVDKLGEVVPEQLLAVPLGSSFCQFVLRDGVFTVDGSYDPRLVGHPYKGVVNAYVGLPLMKTGGELLGTFCHFDFEPLQMADSEFQFLEKVTRELPQYI
ncbi:GAF domain-containing protein [Ottowia thiooxydans]|uniref:GAF domain-containing protein n=1 Tax=Ottowia thiooxydans TaxID=219182 RepID=A0ABV2Q5Z8_9BURK